MEEVNSALVKMHKNYYSYEWTWAIDVLENFYGKSIADFNPEDIISIVKKWKECVLGIDNFLYEDARKEFAMVKMTGFGVDGKSGAKELDFTEVRGEFEKNETVQTIRNHMHKKEQLGDKVIELMKKIEADPVSAGNA